jgi:hypothetical protein
MSKKGPETKKNPNEQKKEDAKVSNPTSPKGGDHKQATSPKNQNLKNIDNKSKEEQEMHQQLINQVKLNIN